MRGVASRRIVADRGGADRSHLGIGRRGKIPGGGGGLLAAGACRREGAGGRSPYLILNATILPFVRRVVRSSTWRVVARRRRGVTRTAGRCGAWAGAVGARFFIFVRAATRFQNCPGFSVFRARGARSAGDFGERLSRWERPESSQGRVRAANSIRITTFSKIFPHVRPIL